MTGGVLFGIMRIWKQHLLRQIRHLNARSVAFELIKTLSVLAIISLGWTPDRKHVVVTIVRRAKRLNHDLLNRQSTDSDNCKLKRILEHMTVFRLLLSVLLLEQLSYSS